MEAISLEPARRTALRPWLIILLTGPLLIVGLGLGIQRWQTQKQDAARLTEHFVQRQNKVLAYDALRAGQAFAQLLSQAARDVRLLSTLVPSSGNYVRFFEALRSGKGAGFPEYNRLLVWEKGGPLRWVQAGKSGEYASVDLCLPSQLCDRATLEKAQFIPIGKALVGKGLRWYTPRALPLSIPEEGTLSVAFHGTKGVYVLGVDFKSFAPLLRLPTFPYQERGDLLQDYENGNYIYFLDENTDLLAHPRRWHTMGMDRSTGKPMAPMRSDAEVGTRPLNFRLYQYGKLRPYFDRFLARTYRDGEVDVFQASNLSGMSRIISIAPVFLDAEVFEQKGPYGYVGVGCAVEHFQEPQERLVPYY